MGGCHFQIKRIMWWAVSPPSPKSFFPLIPKSPATTRPLFPIVISASSQPPGLRPSSPVPRSQKQGGTKQLSGLDVLWAMQRAAAEKNKLSGGGGETKKRKKRKGIQPAQEEEDDVDYSNVKPLCIKSDWGVRLDELEKSLEELSDTK